MKNLINKDQLVCLFVLLFTLEHLASGAPRPFSRCEINIERGAQIRGSSLPLWWYTREVPRPSRKRRFVPEAFERWGAAQPDEFQYIVDFVRDNLLRVSQAKFEAELKKAFKKFLKNRKSNKPLLFLVDSDLEDFLGIKSSTWVTALLRAFFSDEMRSAEYVVITNSFAPQDLKKIASGNYDVVIAEDAAFVGRQISDFIAQKLSVGLLVAGLPSLKELHFICPFVMNQVFSAVQSVEEVSHIEVYSTVIMPSIEEMLATLPPQKKKVFDSDEKKQTNLLRMLPRNKALVYFDHKIPDYWSIPNTVFKGLVYEMTPWGLAEMTTKPKVQFLRINDEPYKDKTKY